jgi:hypothetical protein
MVTSPVPRIGDIALVVSSVFLWKGWLVWLEVGAVGGVVLVARAGHRGTAVAAA